MMAESSRLRAEASYEEIAIIIPTLNEERAIGRVLDSIPIETLLEQGYETTAYVVDGNSTDNTRRIAAEMGATVILEKQKGKGSALQTAFTAQDADYVIVTDGDDTYPLETIPSMVRLLKTNDVVIGSRLKGSIEPHAMTTLNFVGNMLLTSLARLLFFSTVSDVCTGLWGYRGNVVKQLELVAHGFEIEADMFAECVRKGFTIAEIPITYRAREGQAKLSSVNDGLKIGAFLIKKYFEGIRGGHAPSHKQVTASTTDDHK